jgi:hypothetical protein
VGSGGPHSEAIAWSKDSISSTSRLSSKVSKANVCLHQKERSCVAASGMQTMMWYTAANPTVRMDYFAAPYDTNLALTAVKPIAMATLGNNQHHYLGNNAVTLMTENFDSLKPDLTELSVPNFILDLDQISQLFKFWKYGAGLIKNAANANLNYQFGWRPTLGDGRAAYNAVANLHTKLEAFRKRLGKLSKKQKRVDAGSETHTGTYVGLYYTSKWRITRTWTCDAFIAYRPLPIPEMTAFEEHLRGILDSLGFELNLQIVWDAIPFSFILDWFLDVGLICRQFRLDTLELPIKLEDSYLQYKEKISLDVTCQYRPTSDHTGIECPGGNWTMETFHRLPSQPDYQSLVWNGWHFPSLNQAVLGLSLGFSR